jgi:hypothetical protein
LFWILVKTAFSTRMFFIRVENAVGARSAQFQDEVCWPIRAALQRSRDVARTDAVRADRRLGTDDEAIRA